MSIVIDSLQPNEACSNPPTVRNDNCQITVSQFHIRDDNTGQVSLESITADSGISLIFIRSLQTNVGGRQVVYGLDEARLLGISRNLLREHHFTAQSIADNAELQNALELSSVFGRALRIGSPGYGAPLRAFPHLSSQLNEIYSRMTQFILVGNATHNPDSIQVRASQNLLTTLLNFDLTERSATDSEQSLFQIFDNAVRILPNANQRILTAGLRERFSVLQDLLNISNRFQTTLRLPPDSQLTPQLRQFFARVVNHLYFGSGSLNEIRTELSRLAAQHFPTLSQGDQNNLYRILGFALEPLLNRPPFDQSSTSSAARGRLQMMMSLLRSPSLQLGLQYASLEPAVALERSVLDRLRSEAGADQLLQQVNSVIQPPHLTRAWLLDNGHLRDVVRAIFASIRLEQQGQTLSFNLNQDQLHTLRFNIDTLINAHGVQRREFAAATLAVLRSLFDGLPESVHVNAFFQGQMNDLTWNLSSQNRETLRGVIQWLQQQVGSSLSRTQVVLPLVEGATCLVGAGLITAGAFRPTPGQVNPLYVSGGGVAGLGCGALLTHYIIPTRNPYISDSIGGVIGAGIGVAIPLIIQAVTGGQMPQMPPIDGRGPNTPFGP